MHGFRKKVMQMRKIRYMDTSVFICPACGNKIPLMRKRNRQREKGHIKDLWCPFCRTDRKFLEIRRGDWYTEADGNIVYV